MKFKIGDKVKIISLDMTRKFFGTNEFKWRLLGKTETIQNVSKSCYYPDVYRYGLRGDGFFHEDDLILVNNELEIE
jgi:hypothetical protein